MSFDILQDLSKEGKISAYDIGNTNWIDVQSPMVLERNQKEVKKYLAKVREKSPELAERYAYLEGDEGTRARAADEELPFIWAADEE